MPASYAFHHVDVFTDTPLEGNQLAVFPDAQGLDGATMQRIAREFNLAETSFVLPPGNPHAEATLRIFTPFEELKFAGHPTIGTAFVLWTLGRLASARSFAFEEGIGLVPVRIDETAAFKAWLTTPPVSFGSPCDGAVAAAALGLDARDLLEGAPVRRASAGNPFLYVAVRDTAATDRVTVDGRAFRELCSTAGANGAYVFALVDGGVYSRLFAPELGIVEGPATGSATGPLAAYLLEHGLVPERDPLSLVSRQGVAMGRPSRLDILVRGTGSGRTIEVGGSVAPLMTGTLTLA